MEPHLQKTLEQAKAKLRDQEAEVLQTKRFINQLCAFGGMPPMYTDTDLQASSQGLAAIRGDSFYGKSATTAAREYLEMRQTSGQGAATYAEIIAALKEGGFNFSSLSQDETVAMRAIAINLGKNSQTFHKLPNGKWGLLAWYPDVKERKQKKGETERPVEDSAKTGPDAGTQEKIELSA
jgi:hypothetical protein